MIAEGEALLRVQPAEGASKSRQRAVTRLRGDRHEDGEKGRYVWRWGSIRKIREKEPLKVK